MEVALVGCAHIHTPGFVKRLNDRDGVHVKYVWDHDENRASENAVELGATQTDDITTIWNDKEVTAVVICSETDRHGNLVTDACKAGKHMFLEKPLGIGTNDAYEMAEQIAAAGVIFQTGYFQRGKPVNRFVKEAIAKGLLGKISRIRMSNCHSGAIRDIFTPKWLWMTDPEIAGVGAFGDLGTHVLDIMMWLIDSPVKRVTASTGSAFNKYGAACDEYGEGLLEFANGTIGSIAAGWVDVSDPVYLVVSGTEGYAHVVDGKLYFKSDRVDGADGVEPWVELPDEWPHAFELFLDELTGAAPPAKSDSVPLVDVLQAARRSDVMEAMYRAARDGSWTSPERE